MIAPHGSDPQVIILSGMDPPVAVLPDAGPQAIVVQATVPPVIAPHGPDPQVRDESHDTALRVAGASLEAASQEMV